MYLQLMEQVKHAINSGVLREGDRLPTIRKVAEDLVMNANTVARAYRELEHEGLLETRHGSGVFVAASVRNKAPVLRKAQSIVQPLIERLIRLGLTEEEVRRVFEDELALIRSGGARREEDQG
jgi:GntR family transcriptional regulator